MQVLSLLGAALVVLKALGYIHLSWSMCLAPFVVQVALYGLFLLIAALTVVDR